MEGKSDHVGRERRVRRSTERGKRKGRIRCAKWKEERERRNKKYGGPTKVNLL